MHYRHKFLVKVLIVGAFLFRASFAFSGEKITDTELARGNDLYHLKCVKCHQLRNATDYDDETWAQWMLKMKKKAHLKDDEFNLISAYTSKLRKDSKISP